MKTMIWKELRENFKWAVLALLGLTLAEFYGLSEQRQTPGDYYNDLTLCSSTFLLVTSFGCSIIGAALGIVQILPELRRDQWAALLHRPVSRGVIFSGKVAAGLLLYFGATLLPFLASIFYVAVPGQFAAPLVPGLLLPAFSDVFLGPVFYFAAILLCLHRGRWFGSRGLLGLSVLPVFLLHLSTGWPFLFPILSALVFLLAAWGTMLSNGPIQGRPWAARIAQLAVTLAGALTAWIIIILGLQFLPQGTVQPTSNFTEFEVTRDGQVFFATQQGLGGTPVVTDMTGKVITDERYVGNNTYGNFCQLLPLADFQRDPDRPNPYLSREPRNLQNYVLIVQQGYEAKELWFLLVRENYFIGYDKLSRRCVGIFDADGYKPAGVTPKPFPLPVKKSMFGYTTPFYFWSGPQLYALDFSERTMKPFFNAQDQRIFGAADLNRGTSTSKSPRVFVTLDDGLHLLDTQGKSVMVIPYRHDPGMWSYLWAADNPDLKQIYLQFSHDQWLDPVPQPVPVFLDVFDAQGNFVQTYSHPSEASVPTPESWVMRLAEATSPLFPVLAVTIYDHVFPPSTPTIETGTFWEPSFQVELFGMMSLFAVSLGLGILTFFWARRVGFSPGSARLWTLFVLCFGLPGLVTFRLASDWPTRVRCPQCGRHRPIATAECPGCHQPWPIPAANGAEIFDLKKIKI